MGLDQKPPREDGRIRGLDGLRAISILFVLASHQAVGRIDGLPEGTGTPWHLSVMSQLGSVGVAVFFGISGYLITTLLLREEERTGTVSLRAFIGRRAFRILPPYWAFLAGSVLLCGVPSARTLGNCLAFLTDYRLPEELWLIHTWSLSVEEQFYLTWPVVLLLAGRRVAGGLAFALLLASPLVRLASHFAFPAAEPAVWHMLHTRYEPILAGSLLAILRRAPAARPWLARLERRSMGVAGWTVVCALPAALGLAAVAGPSLPVVMKRFLWYLAPGVQAAAIGLVLLSSTAGTTGRAILERPWLVRIGVVSYSLYLWQQPFFSPPLASTWAGRFPLNLLGAYLLAELSYRFVEGPALRLRDRLLGRSTRPTGARAPVPQALR